MQRNRTDLRFRRHTHVRPKETDTGSHDIVHISHLQISAAVLPEDLTCQIQREQLSVMRMSAEIRIHTGGRKLIQLLSVDDRSQGSAYPYPTPL